jgi:hypothetical protein
MAAIKLGFSSSVAPTEECKQARYAALGSSRPLAVFRMCFGGYVRDLIIISIMKHVSPVRSRVL